MPTYVYKFIDSGETIEIQQAFTDDPLTEAAHPSDGKMRPVKKVFTPVGVTFKGGGFYKTDSKSSSSAIQFEFVGLIEFHEFIDVVDHIFIGFIVGFDQRIIEQRFVEQHFVGGLTQHLAVRCASSPHGGLCPNRRHHIADQSFTSFLALTRSNIDKLTHALESRRKLQLFFVTLASIAVSFYVASLARHAQQARPPMGRHDNSCDHCAATGRRRSAVGQQHTRCQCSSKSCRVWVRAVSVARNSCRASSQRERHRDQPRHRGKHHRHPALVGASSRFLSIS